MLMRFTPINFKILFFGLMIFISSCGGNDDAPDPTVEEVDSTETSDDDIVGGVPFPLTFTDIHPDSVNPPEIIPAGEPIFQQAHSNINPVDEPLLELLSTSIPYYTIGQDTILEPTVEEAVGKVKSSGYNEPVPSTKYDFNDAASYNIQGIDVDQGLSSSYVTDMIEDKRGNLWFATWTAGVTMYNGRSFITIDHNKGLQSNYIWSIFEDKAGNIWFGSDGSGASVYDGHNFTEYADDSPLEDHVILDITGDEEGNVWLATNNGAVMYDGESFYRYTTDQGMSGNYILSVCVGQNGDVWFAVDGGGINKFDGEGFTHYTTDEGLISNYVLVVYEDREENIWVGTASDGVCMYDGYSFITYQEEMGLPNNQINAIIQDELGNMWFGTEGGGACMFNRFQFEQFSINEGMSNNLIWSILEDSDGNIWFGTFGAGANVYNERSFENYTESQGLIDHIVRNIFQDQRNNLWFCTRNGVSKYDGKHFWHYTTEQGLIDNNVRIGIMDSKGDYWFGTNGDGVSRFDGENFYNYNTSSGLSGDFILCIFEDSKQNIWIGTYGGGVTKFHDGKFSHLTVESGLADNTVHSIIEDEEGNIYFGTKSGGLDIYDGKEVTHTTVNEGLTAESVISMQFSSDGTLWAGSEGNGLNQILEDTIITHKLDGGNSHNIIWSIIEDYNGDLWLGTERGLNKFSIDDSAGVEVTHYGKPDGLKGSDFYPSSAIIDDQNRLWWGTGKALAMLDLNKYEQIMSPPRIQITDVRLEQTFVDYRKLKDSIDKGQSYFLDEDQELDISGIKFDDVSAFTNCPERLELPYYLNHLTFYFSGIDWSAPHKVRYQYMLQGLDESWRPITEENWAVYSNTPSGEYIFKVRAIGDAGVWSEVLSYPVIIHPPWWTTWWAYILYLLAALLTIYFYIRFRTAKLLQNKKQLEDIVTLRTAEVVSQKEIVERKNQEITASINYAKRIQTAILPAKSYIDSKLPKSFVLYKPKDIVAGDFYWMEEIDDILLLAAADCTGHGVPGAMVSVVCNNALIRAVREFKLKSPAAILNKVREIVIEKFTSADMEIQDGMDISLIALDKKNNSMAYSGANNNLYLIRNGKLQEFIADKMPVGRYLISKEFTEITIQLEKGDKYYIFTDGFADQFGGPDRKKFKYSNFKQMFVDIDDIPILEQKEKISAILHNWQGKVDQIDDICVIGFEIE